MQKISVIKCVRAYDLVWCVSQEKRQNTLLLCSLYKLLNSVTNPDVFPLPRINLLNQLGKSKYYTILDLVSGYWQIRVHNNSQEFCYPLWFVFEFKVMSFGVRNASAAFQWLIQRVAIIKTAVYISLFG